MFDWLKKFYPYRKSVPFSYYQALGAPYKTAKNYYEMADEGYASNVIVYRSVNLIAHNLASVPWMLTRRGKNVTTHPLLGVIETPNPVQTRASFVESLAAHILLSGNAYVECVETGGMKELYLLRPDRVQILPGPRNIPQGYIYTVDGKKRLIHVDPYTGQSSLLHLKLFHPLNDWYGMSPIEAAASAIDQHNAVGHHNLALLQNGGRPTGALMIKPSDTHMPLTPEQRETIKEELRQGYEGTKNSGRMLVLEGDLEWKEMGMSPKDLDFLNGKYISAREIAQAYGVPPMLVGVPGDATFSNYREARFHLWEDTILPLLNTILSAMNAWLLGSDKSGFQLSYDMDEIPALALRREPIWERLKQADFLTADEKRAALGYPPLLKDSFK